MARLRPIAHEEHLSLIEHLDELRSRLIVCLVVFGAVFAVCFWQKAPLIDLLNRPLERVPQAHSTKGLETTTRLQTQLRDALVKTNRAVQALAEKQLAAEKVKDKRLVTRVRELQTAVAALPKEAATARQPVTLGVGEPFTATLTIVGAFALLFSLPLILYQLYAFILPAFTDRERRVATPLLSAVPALFIAGVVFGYFVVVPPAVSFLQNFNSGSFDILVQAKDYYRFELLALLSMGILFQIPVAILIATRLGVVSPQQLKRNRRYAVLVIAIVAMLLPGTDPVTMLLAMAPLLVLYEGSVQLVSWLDHTGKLTQNGDSPEE